jgi:ribosomal protein S17E
VGSKNEVIIDEENLQKVTDAFKNKLTTDFEEPLTTVLEQHKDGIRPLTGYYISAKKGKNQVSKKIAKEVVKKFIEVFAVDFISSVINSAELTNTLETVEEHVGVDGKGKPKFNQDFAYVGKEYFVKFIIKKGFPPKSFYEKIIFETSFSGGFYDMQLIKTLSQKRFLNLGDLGGDFLISVVKLPFMRNYKINQRMYDKYTSIKLNDLTLEIPKLVKSVV